MFDTLYQVFFWGNPTLGEILFRIWPISLLLAFLLAYFIGSIPFGLWLVKLKSGIDLREFGSNNIGATNAYRASGKYIAALTIIADGGKAILVAAIAAYYLGDPIGLATGLVAILGHNFSIFLKFRGGKGVASTLGVLLYFHWIYALFAIAVWVLMLILFRVSSLSALTALTALLILSVLDYGIEEPITWFMVLVTILMISRHSANIARIIHGTEPQIGGGAKMISIRTPLRFFAKFNQ